MSSRAAAAPPSTRRTLVTTGVGNALEWYDWGIYATFSIYFATEIFAPHDPVAAILGAWPSSPWGSWSGRWEDWCSAGWPIAVAAAPRCSSPWGWPPSGR